MSDYFNNPDDLREWVRSRGSYNDAAKGLMEMITTNEDMSGIHNDEQDIVETCQSIYENDGDDASEVLFGVLAKHNITRLNKKAQAMTKEAQCSRQRNKWNRVVDGFNEGTPWRVGRDQYYDFTHYYTDEIKFDEDPNHIYSGEAIWRTYVMDKFYRDYQDKDGKVVGGYINDRFHVFPTAGTPANPDAPRDGGNQMALADGERTRKPRPHQYSTERRLEEARGNQQDSIVIASSKFEKIVKCSSKLDQEIKKDRIYNMIKDTIEMREAGIDYGTMIDSISDHYNASVLGVSQIDKIAQKLISKHSGIGYDPSIKTATTLAEALQYGGNNTLRLTDPRGAIAQSVGGNNQIRLDTGSSFVNVPNMKNVYEITDHPSDPNAVGTRVSFQDMNFEVSAQPYVQEAADELGLNEEIVQEVEEPSQAIEAPMQEGADQSTDFPVTQM